MVKKDVLVTVDAHSEWIKADIAYTATLRWLRTIVVWLPIKTN